MGTAIGFIWAGNIAAATGGQWGYAFLGEVPLMLPFAISAWFIPNRLKGTGGNPSDAEAARDSRAKSISSGASNTINNDDFDAELDHEDTPLVYDSPKQAKTGAGCALPRIPSCIALVGVLPFTQACHI